MGSPGPPQPNELSMALSTALDALYQSEDEFESDMKNSYSHTEAQSNDAANITNKHIEKTGNPEIGSTSTKRKHQIEHEETLNKVKVCENIHPCQHHSHINAPSSENQSGFANSPSISQISFNSKNSAVDNANNSPLINKSISAYEKCKDNIFSPCDVGPYSVYIEVLKKDFKIHAMTIGKLIRDQAYNNYKDIISISKVNVFKVKIVLSSLTTANQLVKQAFWESNGLGCYVPSFLLFRQGIVKDVDPLLTEEEILEWSQSELEIIKVKRIFKNINNVRRPLPVINVTFKGQFLPEEIKILGVICRVTPYVQRVVQCFNCLSYGHTSLYCRRNQRCEFCGKSHEKGT